MPKDSKGGYHMNTQRAMAADRMGESMPPRKAPAAANEHAQSEPQMEGEDSTRTTIHHGEDGSHMVEHGDGETTGPHGDIHEAVDAIREKHDPQMGMHHSMHGGAHSAPHAGVRDGGGEMQGM